MNPDQQQLCARIAARIIDRSLYCLASTMTIKQIRPLAAAFLRNSEFTALILSKILGSVLGSQADQIQYRIWTNYKVVVIPEDSKTRQGLSLKFSVAELLKFEAGYANIQKVLVNRFGSERLTEFSHVWGAFGVLARVGKLFIKGQFGEVYGDSPMPVNVVVNVVKANFKDTDLAQRIAHEKMHSSDLILDRFLTGVDANWSTTARVKIFTKCGLSVGDDVELFSCRNKILDWFNFHPTNYAATNAPEFYGKMMDEWIRENLSLVSAGRYRCQNQNTVVFWNEMETHFIGESISAMCKNN